MSEPSISVVIPVYNGGATIKSVVTEVMNSLKIFDLEIVLVDDGSKDNSASECAALAETYSNINFLQLTRNFGEHNAVLCGLTHTTKEFSVIIDDDFQNPPSEIIKLINKAKEGYDVVYSSYAVKQHSGWRNLVSKINDRMATWFIKKPKSLYLSSFKLIRREIVDEVIKYHGPYPYIDGLILRVTRNVGVQPVLHAARKEGRSNYTLTKLLSLHINMLTNFSVLPLRCCSILGAIMVFAAFAFSIVAVVERLANPSLPLGWASIFISVFLLSGTQLIFLGILGEYIGKMYLDQNGTPPWVARKKPIITSNS